MADHGTPETYDVVILGAGQAGLSLARQLLLAAPDQRILVLDRRTRLPAAAQKVGEATVQVSGYYFSRVLDLEEHLLTEHLMKYNLRFHWKNAGRDNADYEDYSQSYIRPLSNIASYQIDRNKLERELIRRNREHAGFELAHPAREIEVDLGDLGDHRVRFTVDGAERAATADWVVDCTGRGSLLARRLGLRRPNPIRHGAAWLWVDGLLDVERLTSHSRDEVRLRPERSAIGHLPIWLATNHFMGDGYWLWVIPLHGVTSIGLVYEHGRVDPAEIRTSEGLVDWICREWPLFRHQLREREVRHRGGYLDFSYDCAQTLSSSGWALSGEAGRFSDPLYSPGGDLIAIYNTLIADAILTGSGPERVAKCRAYEGLMRAVYEAYVPSFSDTYAVLGDQEAYSLKYTWELTVYFAFYVFPFINDLFTDRRFIISFLKQFSRLGPLNRNVLSFLGDYHGWKRERGRSTPGPTFHDFTDLGPLAKAEKTFYEVGVGIDEARRILAGQVDNLEELGRYILAYVASEVLGEPEALVDRRFVEGIDPATTAFEPDELERLYRAARAAAEPGEAPYEWSFCPRATDRLRQTAPERRQAAAG